MSQSIGVTEENQQDQLLKFTEDIPKAIDTSLGDIKLKLDLSDDAAQTSLPDSIFEDPKENSSALNGEAVEVEKDNSGGSLNLQDRPNEHEYGSAENVSTRKHFTLWVSNISRNMRANDLKKHFSKSGNVLSAKILTNGKNFYGCVSLETCDQANQCLKELNNSVIEGNVIHVSKNRPDMRKVILETKSSKSKVRRVERHKDFNEKQLMEKDTDNPDQEIKDCEITEKHVESKKLISDLERRLKNAHADISRMKRKLDKYERKKSLSEKNSRREMEKIRSERRLLNQDKENFEKTKRDFQKEITNKKASVLKELDEARALRIKLQNRLDNFLTSTPRSKRESRSPLTRNARSNIGRSFEDDNGRKSKNREWTSSKRPRKENPVTSKLSPPSPPRLSEFDRRGPQRNEHFLVNRPYYSDERHHSAPEKSSNIRQKLTFINFPRENRNSYPMTYVKEDSKHQTHIQPFPNDRFGNPMQTAPQMLGPSRTGNNQYVNEYGKHYGHY